MDNISNWLSVLCGFIIHIIQVIQAKRCGSFIKRRKKKFYSASDIIQNAVKPIFARMPATTFFLVHQEERTLIVSPAIHLKIRVIDCQLEPFDAVEGELHFYLKDSLNYFVFETINWQDTALDKITAALQWYAGLLKLPLTAITTIPPAA